MSSVSRKRHSAQRTPARPTNQCVMWTRTSPIVLSFPTRHYYYYYAASLRIMVIFAIGGEISPLLLLSCFIPLCVLMWRRTPTEGVGNCKRVAKCLQRYSLHFLPDLCCYCRVHFRLRLLTFQKVSPRESLQLVYKNYKVLHTPRVKGVKKIIQC
jgi:hypothetical protein